jgi:hypothetical protein
MRDEKIYHKDKRNIQKIDKLLFSNGFFYFLSNDKQGKIQDFKRLSGALEHGKIR